ncbi:MAG: 30S ribosomal protein S27e [Nanoarchaeota archaeon]|nr:30S ribosomal protein S27e [Nanoarchaeota archaeon]
MPKFKKTKFLKIGCPRCNTTRIVFGKSASIIKCSKCNYMLLKTTGGKAKVRGPIKEVLWH